MKNKSSKILIISMFLLIPFLGLLLSSNRVSADQNTHMNSSHQIGMGNTGKLSKLNVGTPGFDIDQSKWSTDNSRSSSLVKPKHKPTGDPIIFFGFWLTTGYDLQPQDEMYGPIGGTTMLTADSARSAWDFILTLGWLSNPKYEWYYSTDGINWEKYNTNLMSFDGTLPVSSNNVGTVYYQQHVKWGIFPSAEAWSRVTTIHWLPEPVNATSISVNADDDYLMNNIPDTPDSTHVHVTPTPTDATAKSVKWSSSDSSIATVDETTGKVTAVNGKSGVVTVECVWTNYDGTVLRGSTKIEVGGGLKDQTVHVGSKATFKLLGKLTGSTPSGSDVSVEWHKVTKNGNDSIIKDADLAEYTTPATVIGDDGTHFYAVITIKSGSQKKMVRTNQALLTVIPNDAKITVKNTVFDRTYPNSHNEANTEISKVQKDDELAYKDTIRNETRDVDVNDGTYVTYIHAGDALKDVKVDGKSLSSSKYSVSTTDDRQKVTIKGLKISGDTQKSIELDSSVGGDTSSRASFEFQPYFINNSQTVRGTKAVISYISSDGVTMAPKNINYGTHANINNSVTYNRDDSTNSPNSVIDFDDQRRTHDPLTLTVTQSDHFSNENSVKEDDLSLRYYEQGDYTSLSVGQPVVVHQFENGDVAQSVKWDANEGLRLSTNGNPDSGTYHTTLVWTLKSGY